MKEHLLKYKSKLFILVAIISGVLFLIFQNCAKIKLEKNETSDTLEQNLKRYYREHDQKISSGTEDSPFGFHPGNAKDYSYIKDLGAKWSREGTYLRWEWIDKNRDGNFKFTKAIAPSKEEGGPSFTINYDEQWLNTPESIHILANICPFAINGDLKNSEEEIYQNFVKKTVERYDGDEDYGCDVASPDCYKQGDLQYPTEKIQNVFKKNPINYWQVCNLLSETCDSNNCKENYASAFALVQEKTYKGAKEANESVQILIAGDSGKEEYSKVFENLKGQYLDIIDFHRFGTQDWYNPKNDFDFLKEKLQTSGFNLEKIKFWITETGTYSGDPTSLLDHDLPYQNEKQQARGLIKTYIAGISYGIKKIFWAWNIVEGFQKDCGFFDYTSLVYDGCDCIEGKYTCGTNVGYDKGIGVKKLSYYSYKKMVEILKGINWNNTHIVKEENGIYIYKFFKNGNPIWIAWNDNEEEKKETLSGIKNKKIKLTESIPKYETGKEISDYKTAFRSYTLSVKDGSIKNNKISFILGKNPIFIE